MKKAFSILTALFLTFSLILATPVQPKVSALDGELEDAINEEVITLDNEEVVTEDSSEQTIDQSTTSDSVEGIVLENETEQVSEDKTEAAVFENEVIQEVVTKETNEVQVLEKEDLVVSENVLSTPVKDTNERTDEIQSKILIEARPRLKEDKVEKEKPVQDVAIKETVKYTFSNPYDKHFSSNTKDKTFSIE